MGDSGPAIVVGRSRERNLVQNQINAALNGHGSVVILSGEAGIGKTTLALDACRAAAHRGAVVLTGHCYDGTNTPPYGPWIELLELFDTLPDMAPILRGIPEPNLSGGTSQAAIFSQMRGFLNAIAAEQPLVILFEDMHWADSASFDLLRIVARHIGTVPITLLMTYRSEEVARKHPLYHLVPLLVREALAVRIDLSPLSDRDVLALIEHDYQLPAVDAERLTSYVQGQAEGNPFFVSELLRSLEGSALMPTTDGTWSLGELARIEIPLLLQQVIDARLTRLGSDADDALAIAAVIGEIVPLELWANVCEMTEEDLFPLMERAIEARVFIASPDGMTLRFSHALVREALYQRILPARRRVIHRQIGDALERQSRTIDVDEVAYHFSQARDARAVHWLTRAGERAQRAFAYRAAGERYETALAHLEGDDRAPNERGWLNFRLALLRRFQDPTAGEARLATAERLGRETSDAALVAYSRYFRAMLRRMAGNYQDWVTSAEEGIALIDALSPEDHSRLAELDTTSDPLDAQNGRGDLALVLGEIGPFSRAVELGERIVNLPREETFGSRGDAFYGLGYAYSALGRPQAARAAFGQASEIFRADDHRSMVLAALFDELVLSVLPYQADRPIERERLEAELTDAFLAFEDIFQPAASRMTDVVSATLHGRWHDALSTMQQSSPRYIRLVGVTVIAPIAFHLGNAELAWSLVSEGMPAGPDTSPSESAGHIVPLRRLAVALALDAGDLDLARRWLDSFDDWIAWSGAILGRSEAHLCWSEFFRTTGDRLAARDRAEQALQAAQEPRQPLTLVAAHRLLGEIETEEGRLDDAQQHLSAALMLARACQAKHEEALTMLSLADLHRARGDLLSARGQVADARRLCGPMDAARTLARIDKLEQRLNSSRAGAAAPLPANLTPREAEVLRLLASGMANAEIAEQLSLSPRTVNAHLTTIYSKLGVTTRGAAIRFALDHGLR